MIEDVETEIESLAELVRRMQDDKGWTHQFIGQALSLVAEADSCRQIKINFKMYDDNTWSLDDDRRYGPLFKRKANS